MAKITDFHTHAFPETIAATAIGALENKGNVKAYLDGTIDGLLTSMDKAAIGRSVVCSIATRPAQFSPILAWSQQIRSERIVPLPSVHPADADWREHLVQVRDLGFVGIKMHPYYQDFFVDDEQLFPLYEHLANLNLLLVMHTGFDIGFPRVRRADPQRILNVWEQFPELKLVTTHLGGWDDWANVRKLLTGKPIYMEISFALDFLDQIRLRDLICSHPPGYILFGTDSPWTDQATTLKMLEKLGLEGELFQQITCDNATVLLDLD